MEKSRIELYELVWAKPMKHLAKELGLSDVGLRKICVKYGIPLPQRGYWSRLQFGKQDPRPALLFENNNPQIRLPDEATAATREQISLMRKLAKKAEQAIQPVLREPQQFKDIRCIHTYQAILERIKHLETRTGESYEVYKAGRRSLPPKKAYDLAFFFSREDQIPISATIDNALRAVAIADVIIERLAERAIEVELRAVRDSRVCEMRAVKGDQYYEFRFWEPSTKAARTKALTELEKSVTNYSSGYDTIMLPRHILTIEFDSRYNRSAIQDKVSVKLEQQIDRIVQRIEAKLDQKAAEHLRRLEWEREYERKKKIRVHNERVAKDREQQLERAIGESVDFEKSQQLKRYLKQITLAIERLPVEQKAFGLAWLRMVRELRKGLNPIAERLESFRILASADADSSEEYWGLDYIDEEADPEFDELLAEEEFNDEW
jgi:hypothetical protein